MFDSFYSLRQDTDSFVHVLTPDHFGLIQQYVGMASPPPRGAEDPYRTLLGELSKNKLFSSLQTVTLAELTGMTVVAVANLIKKLKSTDDPAEDVYHQTDIHKHISREELPVAITIATYLGREDLLELLMFAFETARPYQQDKTQWRALGLAAYAGHAKCIDMLFNFHIGLLARQDRAMSYSSERESTKTRMYPYLMDSIEGAIYFDRSDTFQAIALLINSLPDCNISEIINELSLLKKAITLKRYNVALKLLPAYAEMIRIEGKRKYDDFINMYLSCENTAVRRSLISAIRDVIISDTSGFTLLHYLCLNDRNKTGFGDLLIDLLMIGARLDAADQDGATPLECLPQDVMVRILRSIPEALRSSIPSHLLRYFENDALASPVSAPVVAREEAASAASAAEVPTVPSTPAVTASITAASPAVSASSAAASSAPVGGWFYSVLGTVRRISDRIDGVNNNEAPAPQRNTGHR